MNGNTVTRDNLPNHDEAYRCSNSKRRAGCDAGRISRSKLENLVLDTLKNSILDPDNLAANQAIALENQAEQETVRTARRKELKQDVAKYSREIANYTSAIGKVGHSDALLKSLRSAETSLADVRKDLAELDVPLELITPLSQPQLVTASQTLLDLINNSTPEEKRQHLHAIIHEIRAERVGKAIFALVSYYFPPPFDSALTMLPMLRASVGAHRYRQLFTYPASTGEQKPRSK